MKVTKKLDAREAGEELNVLAEIARRGARRMLMTALKVEADDYLERHGGVGDEQGHALVVRNGRTATSKNNVGCGYCGSTGAAGQRSPPR